MKIIIKIILSLAVLISVAAAHAGLYRWTDSDGKVHYSDKVPPSYSQEGHAELSDTGITTKIVLSARERREQEARKKELKEQEAQQRTLEKQQALEEMRDIQLLNMFTSTEELVKVYQSKLEMTDESINLLKARHKHQSKKLEKMENVYENMKNPQTQEVYAKKIDVLLDNLSVYQQAITENYIEKEKINLEFKTNLARFSELMKQKQKSTKKK